MSKQLDAFYRSDPSFSGVGTAEAFDGWLDKNERQHVREVQRIVGTKADGWCGKGTVAAVKLATRATVPDPNVDWFTERVPVPPVSGQEPSSCRQSTMLQIFGAPRPGAPPVDCLSPTNALMSKLLVTDDVGPFRVTGIKPAVESLKRIFHSVKIGEPALYPLLGTAGMLCCRAVRGSTISWSNHSWGTAADVTVAGQLDKTGDGMCQRGLMLLHPFFKAAGWAWGARFGNNEDSHHVECSDELIREWRKLGLV